MLKKIKKLDYIEKILADYDFSKASVLDAGTGRGSASLLIAKQPRLLTCVALSGDKRKGELVKDLLIEVGKDDHKLVYGDLSESSLFAASSFDYILADYLLGELSVEKVLPTLYNFYSWLKPEGKLIVVDREFYKTQVADLEIISMGKIIGKNNLEQFSNREIVGLPRVIMSVAKYFLTLNQGQRSFDYPSEWVDLWLQRVGFKTSDLDKFTSPEKTKTEFEEGLAWSKERIDGLDDDNLKRGLLASLEQISEEYNKRGVMADDVFWREHFIFICAK
jgi:SAM-dependent methyltransferase